MKRFMIFAGENYYPSGGMNDFVGEFDTISQCIIRLSKRRADWWNILDTQTKQVYNNYQAPNDSKIVEWAMDLDKELCNV